MRLITAITATFLMMSSAAHAVDCSTIGGKFENVASAANSGPALANIQRANTKINTLISLCSAQGIEVPLLEEMVLDISSAYPKGGDCDASTIGGQSERAAASVRNQFNRVNTATAAIANNVDTLTSVLLQCIKAGRN